MAPIHKQSASGIIHRYTIQKPRQVSMRSRHVHVERTNSTHRSRQPDWNTTTISNGDHRRDQSCNSISSDPLVFTLSSDPGAMKCLSSAAGIHEQSASGIIHGHTTRTPWKLMIHKKTSCQNSQTALVALGGKTRSQQQSQMGIIGGTCQEQRERSMSTDFAGQEDAVQP